MKTTDLFHNGIVVDDFEGTLERFTAVGGYEWGDEVRAPSEITTAAGETMEFESVFVYSLNEPRLEIIRAIPGTVWEPEPANVYFWER